MSKNVYERLGVRTLINAEGTVTAVGGSLMPPEVLAAMAEAAGWFVSVPELQEKAGARLAEMIGVPAAMVTSGAASAVAVGTAACMTVDEPSAALRLPDTTGLRNEVVLQRAHESGYEPQTALTGARLVWVETREELERALGPRTAMMFFLNLADPLGSIKREEWIDVARRAGVPTFLDAAADLPPVSRLSSYVFEGFDLVAFSGGKAMRGPQCTGLLLGRPDLIAAGRGLISPSMGIGRAMKVGKEEIVGLLAAVERYLSLDHDTEWRTWQARCDDLVAALSAVPGLTARQEVSEIANHSPHVLVEWTPPHPPLTSAELARELWEGTPRIAVLAEGDHALRLMVWTLRGQEHQTLAARIAEVCRNHDQRAHHT
ncbi:MAG: hypothetical protein U0835_05075 [Isosphaeraceae bacterium]